jgi:hypothetical protein
MQLWEEGRYCAYSRDPAGEQRSRTFRIEEDATAPLDETGTSESRRVFAPPHVWRTPFAEHAAARTATWSTGITTAVRDRSTTASASCAASTTRTRTRHRRPSSLRREAMLRIAPRERRKPWPDTRFKRLTRASDSSG